MTMVRKMAVAVLAAVWLGTTGLAAPTVSDTTKGMLAHRGIYDLKLGTRSDTAEVSTADGKLVYEFAGSACDGFSTQFRFVTRMTSTGGQQRVTDMRTTSFEDAAGASFDFVNQTYVATILTEDSKGTATRQQGGTDVTMSRPRTAKLKVPDDALFPTQHMARLIDAAKAGDKVVEIKLYDGTEGGEHISYTTSVIGKELPLGEMPDGEAAANVPELATVRSWPVTISYFNAPKGAERKEETPEYQLAFVLYENGVSRHMKLDYGSFTLEGRLVDFKALPAGACK